MDFRGEVSALKHAISALPLVCRAWKAIVYGSPTLWQDTAARAHIYDTDSAQQRDVAAIMTLCARRSHSTMTRATIRGILSNKMFGRHLDILRCSALTLQELDVKGDLCYVRRDRASPVLSPLNTASVYVNLLQLISQAPRLKRLALTLQVEPAATCYLDHHPTMSHLQVPQRSAARPKELWLDCFISNQKDDTLVKPFFTDLASAVEHFTFCKHRRDRSWRKWAWEVLLSRSQSLRSIDIALCREAGAQLAPMPVVHFPLLQQCTLYADDDLRHTSMEWAHSLHIVTPALQRLKTVPSIASNISAPLLKSAHLMVRHKQDVKLWTQAMLSWPLLESLTIEILPPLRDQKLNTSLVESVVHFLTPANVGQVHAPKLRSLTFLDARVTPPSEVKWHAENWPRREHLEWSHVFSELGDEAQLLTAYQLAALEAQRSCLHKGGRIRIRPRQEDGRSPAAAAAISATRSNKGDVILAERCNALEVIKVRGVPLEKRGWEALRRRSSARVSCEPDPALRPGAEAQADRVREEQGGRSAKRARSSDPNGPA